VLEYAANGQYYWSSDCIRAHAEQSAREKGTTVDDWFRKLDSDIADSTGEFFQEVESVLKAGELRIVFFLEQAPSELKRLVEFLNKQMSLSEYCWWRPVSTRRRGQGRRTGGYSDSPNRRARLNERLRGEIARAGRTDWTASRRMLERRVWTSRASPEYAASTMRAKS